MIEFIEIRKILTISIILLAYAFKQGNKQAYWYHNNFNPV